MTKLITIEKDALSDVLSSKGNRDRYCKELEAGNILFIPHIPFAFPNDDLQFLLAQGQTAGKNHKNIAYKPKTDTISNAVSLSEQQSKRKWLTSDPFEVLAKRFGGKEVPFPRKTLFRSLIKGVKKLGLPISLRSPYDTFMLNLHDFLKENEEFQQTCTKNQWEFPPNSCWAVFSDQVSHAAIAGQYALEQTFIVPSSALIHPRTSPLYVLEKLSKISMAER